MKKLFIFVLMFSFNGVVFSGNNDSSGFRDIKWNSPFSKYKDIMHLVSAQEGDKKFYTIENDDMSFGDIALTSVVYVFFKDKFYSVAIQTDKSSKNSKILLLELKKKYGNPSYSNKHIYQYRWENEKITVSLKCYASTHKCSVKYNSTEMSKNL